MNPARFHYLIVLALLAPCVHAQTADMTGVTFNVPVKIQNYPGSKAAVWCELRNAAGQALAATPLRSGETYAGVGVAYVPVTAGSANASVAVSIGVPRETAALARGWRCILTTTDREMPDPKSLVRYPSIPTSLVPLAELVGNF